MNDNKDTLKNEYMISTDIYNVSNLVKRVCSARQIKLLRMVTPKGENLYRVFSKQIEVQSFRPVEDKILYWLKTNDHESLQTVVYLSEENLPPVVGVDWVREEDILGVVLPISDHPCRKLVTALDLSEPPVFVEVMQWAENVNIERYPTTTELYERLREGFYF